MKKIIAEKNLGLSEKEIEDFVIEICECGFFDGKKTLIIIPDDTRTAPISLLFNLFCKYLLPQTSKLDYLIALGTHRPLSQDRIDRLVGMDNRKRQQQFPNVRIFNHRWDIEGTLVEFGRITPQDADKLTDGMIRDEIIVLLNKIILDYDVLFVVGPTFPHEVIGFSGGNKYFFPGISGGDIVNFTHWLGALYTIPEIIGKKDTAVRRVVDKVVSFIPKQRLCLSLVVTKDGLKGMFFDTPENAFNEAAELSSRTHIIIKEKLYNIILAQAPQMYEDIWTAGKCMYKLMCVAQKGGKLIIYAPHIKKISYTHNEWLHKVGYHIKDYFLKQWERFKNVPGCILAHSSHVKGLGCFNNGIEMPDIDVILATKINEQICKKVNLGYMNPETINIAEYKNREDKGILYVPDAGEYLFKYKEKI